jgi:hypothetical protein
VNHLFQAVATGERHEPGRMGHKQRRRHFEDRNPTCLTGCCSECGCEYGCTIGCECGCESGVEFWRGVGSGVGTTEKHLKRRSTGKSEARGKREHNGRGENGEQ